MAKKETALHEILAVENELGETSNRIQKETTKTLKEKRTIFGGIVKSHTIFDEAKQFLVQVPDIKEVESTVQEHLDFAAIHLARYWRAIFQKEEANQRAKADIIVDGKVLVKDVPSIVLLSMEKKLLSIIAMYNELPTLDATKTWEPDTTYAKPGVFRTVNPAERQHAVVKKEWIEASPATQHHKAQIVENETVEVIGKYTQYDYSGAITSLDKAEKLERLQKVSRAVKMARQRANATTVDTNIDFGSELLAYING